MHPRFHLHENPSFLHSNDLNIIYTFDYTFIKKVKGKKMYANSARMQNQRKKHGMESMWCKICIFSLTYNIWGNFHAYFYDNDCEKM